MNLMSWKQISKEIYHAAIIELKNNFQHTYIRSSKEIENTELSTNQLTASRIRELAAGARVYGTI